MLFQLSTGLIVIITYQLNPCSYYKNIRGTIMKDTTNMPYLLTREIASQYLGIDPKSFDKYFRQSDNLKRFMIGKQERYTITDLEAFIAKNSIN